MDNVACLDINHDVRQRRKDQLAGAAHSARPAKSGKLLQLRRRIVDRPDDTGSMFRGLLKEIVSYLFQVSDCSVRPTKLNQASCCFFAR